MPGPEQPRLRQVQGGRGRGAPKWGPQTSLGEFGTRETLPEGSELGIVVPNNNGTCDGRQVRGPQSPLGAPVGARGTRSSAPLGGPGGGRSWEAPADSTCTGAYRAEPGGSPFLALGGPLPGGPGGGRSGGVLGGPGPPGLVRGGPSLGGPANRCFGTPGGSWGSRLGDPPWWPPSLRVLKPPPEARPPGGPKMGPPPGGLWRARTFPYVEINILHLTVVYRGGPGGPGTPPKRTGCARGAPLQTGKSHCWS